MISVELVALIVLALLVVLLFVLLIKQKATLSSIQDKQNVQDSLFNQQTQSLASLEQSYQQLSEQESEHFSENNQVSKQLEHRIATLKQQLAQLEEKLLSIEHQTPEDKFYARALKLAQKGADVEEIVQECEIPRAEAEMLLSVHARKKS